MLEIIKNSKLWVPFSWIYRKSGLKSKVYSRSLKSPVQTITTESLIYLINRSNKKIRQEKYVDIKPDVAFDAGPMPPEDIAALTMILCHIDFNTIFEFGTNWGYTTASLALNSPTAAQIWTLDICKEMYQDSYLQEDKELADMVLNQTQTGWAYKQTSEVHKVRQIFQDSLKFNWDTNGLPEEFDFILVDACHKYDFVKNDTIKACNRLKSGGLLLWHDYYYDVSAWTDVFKYVNEFAKIHPRVYHLAGTHLAAWIKP